MRPSDIYPKYRLEIRSIVAEHRARNPRVFGSALHLKDTFKSDLDILVDPTPETTMFDIGAIRSKLQDLMGIRVDVLTPGALPDSFRDRVLKEARKL